jgi:hypothetical protein
VKVVDVAGGTPFAAANADDTYAWDLLLRNIDDGLVVPIVGRDLLTVNDGTGERLLYDVFADRLSESLGVVRQPAVGAEKNPLNAIAAQYILQGREPDDIYSALAAINEKSQPGLLPSPALRQLASIAPFTTFVTTTFDGLLPAAVTAERGRKPQVASFSARARATAAGGGLLTDEPLVYYLFGRVSPRPEYVVTDEDALEFVFQLHEARNQKDHFIHQLANKSLLMIGCSFPSWFVRFFLRLTRGRRLLIAERDTPAFIVDPDASADAGLRQFLNDFRTRTFIFSRYSADAFVAELASRRNLRAGDDWEPAMPAGGVFVSYASEDREQARAVVDALNARGLPAWFDTSELRSGDRWEAKINDAIDRAYAFVPIISKQAARSTLRVYRREWQEGIERSKLVSADDAFLFPIVVDDVDRESEAIPREIRAVQWTAFEGGQIPAEFFAGVTAAIRRKKLGARR